MMRSRTFRANNSDPIRTRPSVTATEAASWPPPSAGSEKFEMSPAGILVDWRVLPGLGVLVDLGGLGVAVGFGGWGVGLGFTVGVGLTVFVGLGVRVGFGVGVMSVGVWETVGVLKTGVGVNVLVAWPNGVRVDVTPGVFVRREKLVSVGMGVVVDVDSVARAAAVRVALNCSVASPTVALRTGEDVGLAVGVSVESGTTPGTNWQASGWRPTPASTTSVPLKPM